MASTPRSEAPGSALSRRSLAHGIAWSVPVVAVSSAAPVLAASQPIATAGWKMISYSGIDFGGGTKVKPNTCGSKGQIQFSQSQSKWGTAVITQVTGINSTATLSNLTVTFWAAVDAGTTWTANQTNSCWTTPTATGDVVTNPIAGATATYRAYTSTFTCPITVSGTSWTLPQTQIFDWTSSCQSYGQLSASDPRRYFHYTASITINGVQTLTKDSGWNMMT